MISDVLSDQINELKYYLNEPTYRDWYSARQLAQVYDIISRSEGLLAELDARPARSQIGVKIRTASDEAAALGRGRPAADILADQIGSAQKLGQEPVEAHRYIASRGKRGDIPPDVIDKLRSAIDIIVDGQEPDARE